MKASEFDESKYLNAKSAGKMNGHTYRIYEVTAATVGQEEAAKRKMIIAFEGIDKTLVVNKTNREIMTEAYGDDTDAWVGKTVIVHLVSVPFKGEHTLSIQLEPVTGDHGEQDGQITQAAEDANVPVAAAAAALKEQHTTSPPLGSAEATGKKKRR